MVEPSRDPSPFKEPEHPDYETLLGVIDRISGAVQQDNSRTVAQILDGVCDAQSATFVALGRAMSFLGIQSGRDFQERTEEATRLAMFWIEGLHAGVLFERWQGRG